MCTLDGCHGGAAVLQNVRFGAGVPFSCHRLLVLSGAVAVLSGLARHRHAVYNLHCPNAVAIGATCHSKCCQRVLV